MTLTMAQELENEVKNFKIELKEPDPFPASEPDGSYAWLVLDRNQVKNLRDLQFEPNKLEEEMAEMLNVEKSYKYDMRTGCRLDCYINAFHWALMQHMDDRQISGFFTLHKNLVDRFEEAEYSALDALNNMKECLVGLQSGIGGSEDLDGEEKDSEAPPLYFLTVDQGKRIVDFVSRTIVANFTLYRFTFTQDQDEIIKGSEMTIEHCSSSMSFPEPLQEGVHLKTLRRNSLPNEVREEVHLNDHMSDIDEEDTVMDSEDRSKEDTESISDGEHHEERSYEDRFVDAVLGQVRSSGSASAQLSHVTPEELRAAIRKFSVGLLEPRRRRMEAEIRDKNQHLLDSIRRGELPRPKPDKPAGKGKK